MNEVRVEAVSVGFERFPMLRATMLAFRSSVRWADGQMGEILLTLNSFERWLITRIAMATIS
jgi:hypothetical protein